MLDLAWMPADADYDTVVRYFASLPASKVPYVGTVGERYRLEQRERQLPAHDGGRRISADTPADLSHDQKAFWDRRAAEAAGAGRVIALLTENSTHPYTACYECHGTIEAGEVAVHASRHLGADTYWHPSCFVCKECRELLVDLTYFVHAGDGSCRLEIYCGRHHAERLKPRCGGCDEIIFADECTEAEDRCWHISHFCCVDCKAQLGGSRYVMQDAKPYCCSCFERRFASSCSTCGRLIGVIEGHMMHGETRWHATTECFRCHFCSRSLLGEAFLPKADGAIFCSARCCDDAAAASAAAVAAKVRRRPSAADVGRAPPHASPSAGAANVIGSTGDDRWAEDVSGRLQGGGGGGENFSEGYGSLRNCPSLQRRSLPDVTAPSDAAESSDDAERDADVEREALASSRLASRRGSDKSAASFRQQRRLAFELRRSSRRRRSDGGKVRRSRDKQDATETAGVIAEPALPIATGCCAAARPPPPPSMPSSVSAPQGFLSLTDAGVGRQHHAPARSAGWVAAGYTAALVAAAEGGSRGSVSVAHRPLPSSASVGCFTAGEVCPAATPAAAATASGVYALSPPPARRAAVATTEPPMGLPRIDCWPLPPPPPLPRQQQQQQLLLLQSQLDKSLSLAGYAAVHLPPPPPPTALPAAAEAFRPAERPCPVGQKSAPTRAAAPVPPALGGRVAPTTTKKLCDRDDDDDDDDGYQEGSGRCRHTGGSIGGACPLCTSCSSSSSSDDGEEDVAYEEEVERSRGLRVARDLSRRRTSLPGPKPLTRHAVSAKVVQAAAKTAKQRRTRSGNCVVQ